MTLAVLLQLYSIASSPNALPTPNLMMAKMMMMLITVMLTIMIVTTAMILMVITMITMMMMILTMLMIMTMLPPKNLPILDDIIFSFSGNIQVRPTFAWNLNSLFFCFVFFGKIHFRLVYDFFGFLPFISFFLSLVRCGKPDFFVLAFYFKTLTFNLPKPDC